MVATWSEITEIQANVPIQSHVEPVSDAYHLFKYHTEGMPFKVHLTPCVGNTELVIYESEEDWGLKSPSFRSPGLENGEKTVFVPVVNPSQYFIQVRPVAHELETQLFAKDYVFKFEIEVEVEETRKVAREKSWTVLNQGGNFELEYLRGGVKLTHYGVQTVRLTGETDL